MYIGSKEKLQVQGTIGNYEEKSRGMVEIQDGGYLPTEGQRQDQESTVSFNGFGIVLVLMLGHSS